MKDMKVLLVDDEDMIIDVGRRVLKKLGYRVFIARDGKEAIEIFKLNIKNYPGSANVYDSLGEAYMNSGNREEAVYNYRRSLELNPENDNAREMLERL